ncbi:MAG: universal stress protein [Terriglobales bacterium]
MSALAQVYERKQAVWFRRVVIATDFSAASERALAHALPLIRRYGSAVSIVHAIPAETVTFEAMPQEFDRQHAQAEQEMERLTSEAHVKEMFAHVVVETGSVWEVLSSIIQREDADLLVMGTRGRTGVKKLMLGSVAEEVLRRATCPVLTIGPSVAPVAPGKVAFKTILFATDFGPASPKAFACALALAEDCDAKLILLHMVPPMPGVNVGPGIYGPGFYLAQDLAEWQSKIRKDSARRLMELVPPDAKLKHAPEYVVGLDFLPEGILGTATAHDADLIVMGANRTGSALVAAHTPWSLTHDVICKAKCPVLTILG